MDKKNNRFNLRLDDEMLRDLDTISDIMGFNKAQFARALLKNGIKFFKKKYASEITVKQNKLPNDLRSDDEIEIEALLESMKHML